MHNTGQFLVFRADREAKVRVNITGGPLAYHYQFEEIYIHYGMDNDHGSEHRINNYAFPAEVSQTKSTGNKSNFLFGTSVRILVPKDRYILSQAYFKQFLSTHRRNSISPIDCQKLIEFVKARRKKSCSYSVDRRKNFFLPRARIFSTHNRSETERKRGSKRLEGITELVTWLSEYLQRIFPILQIPQR